MAVVTAMATLSLVCPPADADMAQRGPHFVPVGEFGEYAFPSNLLEGPDGAIWLSTMTGIGRVTADGPAKVFRAPSASVVGGLPSLPGPTTATSGSSTRQPTASGT